MPLRHEVVQRILDLLPDNTDPAGAEKKWFRDVRRHGGWRLTPAGRAAFEMAGIQHWRIPIDLQSLDRRLMLNMNYRIQWPYFITARPPEIWLFSDRDAVMAQLYGDVKTWVNSLGK